MPTTLTNGIQLPDKGSVDWYSSMQSNYNLIDTHLGNTDTHVTAEDKANWNSKQGSLSQAQLDAIAQVATNTSDIATLQSGKADASHTHSSSDITDIGDYATKQYVDTSISGLVDNAPAALDTLKELSTALNDDANFASTVTTALATKANSADLATVATSGDYDDLSNKPSIPTNTSDLNNDSNFVDTSNSAVASGITSAKVTAYDSHIADTDIHVTTADKTKWNNGVTQSYVFRYSGTAITNNSTIAYSTIDNTDNIKSGDKILDVDGKLFEITAVDTTNQTVTVGTALIDLLSSDLFNSANTWSGENSFTVPCKTLGKKLLTGITDLDDAYYNGEVCEFTPNTLHNPTGDYGNVLTINNAVNTPDNIYSSWITQIATNAGGGYLGVRNRSNGGAWTSWTRILTEDHAVPTVTNTYDLGTSTNKWKSVYATNYYYGSNNVEFSTKFVTTDTAQTITETKTFTNTIKSKKEIELTGNRLSYILPEFSASYSGLSLCTYDSNGAVKIGTWKVDDNDNTKHVLDSSLGYLSVSTGSSNSVNIVYLTPKNSTNSKLGDSTNKWNEINGVEPSSLSLPSANLNDIIDISSYLSVLDGSNANTYIAPANGWISITMSNCSGIQAYITGLWGHQIVRPTVGGVRFFMPVLKNKTINILIFGGTIDNARFIPCQGNV